MKSSPLIDISASAISTISIAALVQTKPENFETYITLVPLLVTAAYVALRYIAVGFQISDYETFAAVSKLKKRKKYLHSCISDEHLSEQARQEHQQNYEKVTLAIDELLGR